jgi:hypothetical protein
MDVQVAAARARREIIRVKLQQSSKKDIKQRLIFVTKKLGKTDHCGPCWLRTIGHNHNAADCRGAAQGWDTPGSAYKSWLGHASFPAGHCFRCGLPQVTWFIYFCDVLLTYPAYPVQQAFGVHDNYSASEPCKHGDFLRRIAYAVFDRWLKQLPEAFDIPKTTTRSEYIRWLMQLHKDGNFLNLHHVVIWAYYRREGTDWYIRIEDADEG